MVPNYLSGRKQRVVLPGEASDWVNIIAGVPQGSILGTLVFLIYINDLVEDIQSTIRLFADATSLYIIVDSPDNASNTLNQDLAKIFSWADRWLVLFNPKKTESILFSRKVNKPVHQLLIMNNETLTNVESHKHLGITLKVVTAGMNIYSLLHQKHGSGFILCENSNFIWTGSH